MSSNSPILYEYTEVSGSSNTPPLLIFMLLTISLYVQQPWWQLDYMLDHLKAIKKNSATITYQKAREQGKESTKPKWDTDMVWILAWDTELK